MTKKTGSSSRGRGSSEGTEHGEMDPLFPPRLEEIEEFAGLVARRDRSETYSELLESQCGAADDSQPVEQYDGTLGVPVAFVNTHQSEVGQLQWNNNLASIYDNPGDVSGVRWCTGTLISNDLFLTAGHCFDQSGGGWTRPKDNTTGATITNSEIALNMHVNFNYQVDPVGNLRVEQSFPVLDLVEYRLGGLDFAIVRLGGNPGATFGTTLVSTTDANEGDMLCIIGHPAGMPKRIEAGPTTDLHGDRIGYNDIDTLGGNSGSGILRASDGRIVGVHTNGGCTNPASTGHNHGVRITSIINNSPTLQTLTTPTAAWADNIATLKNVDDGVTIFWLDNQPTNKWLDNPQTIHWLDNPPTNKWLDGPQTLHWLDNPPTSPWADNIGTLKNIDDVKQPALDKHLGDVKLPGTDTLPVDPGAVPYAGTRPFVLSTPHHAQAFGMGPQVPAQGPATGEQYQRALAELEQAIQQCSAELEQLTQQYQQVLAEYQSSGY